MKSRCRVREDGAVVHRTRPLSTKAGRFVGHACRCRKIILTPTGHPSQHTRAQGDDLRVVRPSNAHGERVAAASRR